MSDQRQTSPEKNQFVIGVDVGTGSVRAGVFNLQGDLLATVKTDITLYHSDHSVVEQSADEIWLAVCQSVQQAVKNAGVAPGQIVGIGFDATCSLVIVGEQGKPLATRNGGEPANNIIVWMDHRATEQAKRINATKHEVLKYVGGVISPEMQTPKLLWLKENNRTSYDNASHFFDLTDYLTWRATGDNARSICTLTCKWTYLAHEQRWDADYFNQIGLGDLSEENFKRIGTNVVDTAVPVGNGLTETASGELGLLKSTPVASGLIDAHAGGVGTIGASGELGKLESRMAYIFGTSACSMVTTATPAFVRGVWGPYFSAMIPGYWLNEGGQSAAGAAIDHLVRLHPAAGKLEQEASANGLSLVALLEKKAALRLQQGLTEHELMNGVHVLPEFLGNRSPHADPDSRAMISGLGLQTDVESLIGLYVAGLCSIAYGVRQLTDALQEKDININTLVISGGAGQSALVKQLFANATGHLIAAPESSEPVMLGSAMIAAVAAKQYADIAKAMPAMSSIGDKYHPLPAQVKLHDDRYQIFSMMQKLDKDIRDFSG